MKVFPVAAALVFLALRPAGAAGVASYELPEFVGVGQLFTNDRGELVLTYATSHDGRSGDHFWNADTR